MRDGSKLKKSFGYVFSRLFTPVSGAIFCAALLLTTVTGPFGTFEGMSVGLRALYWLAIVSGAFLVGYTVYALALGIIGERKPLLTTLLASILMTLVFTPYVVLLRNYFSTITDALPAPPATIGLNVFLLSLIILILRTKLASDETGLEDESGAANLPRLLRRLPDGAAGDVVRLEAQGHLIAIVTMTGRETVRMRFSDAIDEMEPVAGFCTHRSHWVVEACITRVERDGPGKVAVRLRNGDRVPVSRKYRPELDGRGFEIT